MSEGLLVMTQADSGACNNTITLLQYFITVLCFSIPYFLYARMYSTAHDRPGQVSLVQKMIVHRTPYLAYISSCHDRGKMISMAHPAGT